MLVCLIITLKDFSVFSDNLAFIVGRILRRQFKLWMLDEPSLEVEHKRTSDKWQIEVLKMLGTFVDMLGTFLWPNVLSEQNINAWVVRLVEIFINSSIFKNGSYHFTIKYLTLRKH